MQANEIVHKIYAGFLGMNVGIRLGAPVEPAFWSYERIAEVYHDIRGYIKDYRHFAADDDANGPVFFLRALNDMQGNTPAAQDVAEAWLNYAREGVGLYWWGGYGVSTEHTAYLNLKNGISAPQSGSILQNGQVLAEQIGGQIFIDTWGLVAPCDPKRAAQYARMAASVSHDGEGLHGAAFMAACIAQAFCAANMDEVMDAGMAAIPSESLYAKVVNEVRAFHAQYPNDWRACREWLTRDWGYDRYGGVCHIIPNAGVCALALCYGAGDFSRTVEIATMCSWDTDCNAGNVGTILGVFTGLEGIPAHYRAPINDEIVLSSISGYLNVLDIPTYSYELAAWSYRLRNESVPPQIQEHVHAGEIHFDFSLNGSTHGMLVQGSAPTCVQKPEAGGAGLLMDRATRGQGGKLFYKPFYRRADFDDERYMPVFSPTVYPGQKLTLTMRYTKWQGEALLIAPFVRETYSGKEIFGEQMLVRDGKDEFTVQMVIPPVDGGLIDQVGVRVTSASPPKSADCGLVELTALHVTGKANYKLSLAKSRKEFGSLLPFSHNHGAWELENGRMSALSIADAQCFTGSYYMRDISLSGSVRPENGASHLMTLRMQGARRGYAAGFDGENQIVIFKIAEGKATELCRDAYPWKQGQEYQFTFAAVGNKLTFAIDGIPLLAVNDASFTHGMVGYAHQSMGRSSFGDMTIEEQ
ncbi:MAG: ADP-ribosylglycohydrolase family protein [Clostridia bacterium]